MTNTFSELFRRSRFASFSPNIPQLYHVPNQTKNIGMKRPLPSTIKTRVVRVQAVDTRAKQTSFESGLSRYMRFKRFQESFPGLAWWKLQGSQQRSLRNVEIEIPDPVFRLLQKRKYLEAMEKLKELSPSSVEQLKKMLVKSSEQESQVPLLAMENSRSRSQQSTKNLYNPSTGAPYFVKGRIMVKSSEQYLVAAIGNIAAINVYTLYGNALSPTIVRDFILSNIRWVPANSALQAGEGNWELQLDYVLPENMENYMEGMDGGVIDGSDETRDYKRIVTQIIKNSLLRNSGFSGDGLRRGSFNGGSNSSYSPETWKPK